MKDASSLVLHAEPAPRPRRGQERPGAAFLVGVGQRLAFGALVLLALMLLTFLGLEMARGSAFRPALAHAAGESVAYLGQLLRGNLGTVESANAALMPRPIADVLRETASKSLGLLGLSLLLATAGGIALGAATALRRHSSGSLLLIVVSIIGVSLPSFFAAILLQWALLQWVRVFDSPAPLPVGGFGWDRHIVLPALVLAARPLAQITRVTFVTLIELLGQDFVRTAHGKGLHARTVMRRHVIRNAAIPILTTIGSSLRFSLSSLPVVELFFGWPGVGVMLLDAIARRDDKLTVVLVLSLGLLFILVNNLLDLSFRLIDPRLRTSAAGGTGSGESVLGALRAFLADLGRMLLDNPLVRWLQRRRTPPEPSPFSGVLARQGTESPPASGRYRYALWRAWVRGTLRNLPFVLGTLLVLGLLGIFVFGPALAPHSPYTRQLIAIVDGTIASPPFKPGITYPWGSDFLGRDIKSLVLVGAQQTLTLAALVVVGRMAIGVLLGALAGWQRGSWLDRTIQSVAEMVSAFPTLLLAMILILALGIRQGVPPFVIALTFVGWGEVMQYVRSEVLAIKPKPFIESAVAIGVQTPRILVGHVLPNLIPALISIAALEMGAVLMLLGELGFIGIFIGGGIMTGEDMSFHYSDVPEWGAMLSNVRAFVRAYPWMALYPAIAFFLAILAFNLFGEGVRRLVDDVGVNLTRLFNRYTFALAIVLLLGWGWVKENTGEAAVYRASALTFSGEQALTHVEALTDPAMDGRALGSAGMDAAATYIADQFAALGLQRAGEDRSYFQSKNRSFETLDALPELSIGDGGAPLRYHEDFQEFVGVFSNMGEAQGEVSLLQMGELSDARSWFGGPPNALRSVDFSDRVLLMLSGEAALRLTSVAHRGALVVTDDPTLIGRAATLSTIDPASRFAESRPTLWISEAVANRLLAPAGLTVAQARQQVAAFEIDQLQLTPLGVPVTMKVEGTVERVPVHHVIGHLPGDVDAYDDKMIVVMAQYDNPPASPDGLLYPGANDNASGVAVMLEALRTLRDAGYQPYKTFLFVAYSGEGQEGGEWVNRPEVKQFLQAKYGFSGSFDIEAVIDLRGVGAGEGSALLYAPGGSLRLAQQMETAAQRMDLPTERAPEAVDFSVLYQEGRGGLRDPETPVMELFWQGWERSARLPSDTLDTLSPAKLEQAGELLAQLLMMLGRDTTY